MIFIRAAKFFAFVILFSALPLMLRAQPKGKWYAGQTLPGLSFSGNSPKLLFVDSLLGYYIGVDTGFVTHDAGITWQMMNFPPDARPSPTFIFAPNHHTIISFQKYNVDSSGIKYPGIIKSTDMGKTWTFVSSTPLPPAVKAFTMWTETDGFRIWADDITDTVYSAATHDGGITFTDLREDAILKKYDTSLVLLPGHKGVIVNFNSAWSDSLHGAISVSPSIASATPYPVLTTTNGGRTWAETYPKYYGSPGYSHSFVYLYPGSQTIWTVPSMPKTALYFFYSTDFGTTWKNTPAFDTNALGVGSKFKPTKPGVVQLAAVSPVAAWGILASDTEHPDLQHFIGYNTLSGGWVRDTIFKLQGGPFGYSLNQIQFTSPEHGWALLTETYFDNKQGVQVTKDSTFLFVFNPAAPLSGAPQTPGITSLRSFPDPASSSITIEGLGDDEQLREIKIFTMLGVEYSPPLIHTGSGWELDIRTLRAGYYFVNVATSARNEVISVIVRR